MPEVSEGQDKSLSARRRDYPCGMGSVKVNNEVALWMPINPAQNCSKVKPSTSDKDRTVSMPFPSWTPPTILDYTADGINPALR